MSSEEDQRLALGLETLGQRLDDANDTLAKLQQAMLNQGLANLRWLVFIGNHNHMISAHFAPECPILGTAFLIICGVRSRRMMRCSLPFMFTGL